MRLTTVFLIAMACAGVGFGQEKPAKPEARGKSEGIKVHGHWVLEVRNPDGSKASRHEYENELQTTGDVGLLKLLTGGASTLGWFIALETAFDCSIVGQFEYCPYLAVAQSATICADLATQGVFPAIPNQTCSTSLTVAPDSTGFNLVLQGTTVPATSNAQITNADSYLLTCPSGTTPAVCLANASFNSWQFTRVSAQAQNFTPLQAGQTVTVTVTLSFS
jgi:hypothetical protein